ncbi:aminoglycoside adenylyltransferase domain-containing protein [Nesterenkonia muleiensis]|uniref:aminoglycoside adenylyltransferase domain-containing protein n=1 Tax=Nesterenkonia muleiensis TaxID=2282648 RepID=UPI000E72FA33|nr:aminoglycoside adenylyltransferase domain-containing protein [Nesterenkonia muleiensis]
MFPRSPEIQFVFDELTTVLPAGVLGFYLCGSVARGEQGPHSDLDLVTFTPRSLTVDERRRLTETLLDVSGWTGHAKSFPEVAHRRPVEFTSFVLEDVKHWQHPPTVDYQYGEWLRADIVAGQLPQSHEDPDATLFLEDARQNNQTICGTELQNLLPPPPSGLLSRACQDAAPTLMEELDDDTRNVLLTLARMAVTISTGTIVSKARAAQLTAPRLPQIEADLLRRAAAEYQGTTSVDWPQETHVSQELARQLFGLVTTAQ